MTLEMREVLPLLDLTGPHVVADSDGGHDKHPIKGAFVLHYLEGPQRDASLSQAGVEEQAGARMFEEPLHCAPHIGRWLPIETG